MSPHILIVAYAFPPCGEIGSRRAVRFARGLATSGWRVTVLTVQSRFHWLLDPSLMAPSEPFTVRATTTLDPLTHVARRIRPGEGQTSAPASPSQGRAADSSISRARQLARAASKLVQPDYMIGWLPPAVCAARRVHRAAPVDIVLATAPPYSALITGATIAAGTRAKLVLDYRDPWSSDREHAAPRWAKYSLDVVERRLLGRADLALFTSSGARDLYATHSKGLDAQVLTNSLDEFLVGDPPAPEAPLCWTYAGSLYSGRSLAPVLRAVAAARPEDRPRVEVIGGHLPEDETLGEQLGIADRITWTGRLPFKDVAPRLRASHRLVAVVSDLHPYSIPAKIFDYMAARRPILLLCEPGHAAAELLAGVDSHHAIAHQDVDSIKRLIERDASAARSGGLPDIPHERMQHLTAPALIRSLDRKLRGLLEAC